MDVTEQQALVSFLTSSSRVTLGDFVLSRLNRVANLRRQQKEIDEQLADNMAHVEFAELLRDHGEEIVGRSHKAEELSLANPRPAVSSQRQEPKNPWHWIKRDPTLSSLERLVLFTIATSQAHNGEARVTGNQLARETGLCRRMITKVLKSLRAKGRIRRTRTGRADVMRIIPDENLVFGVAPRATLSGTEYHSRMEQDATQSGTENHSEWHPVPPLSVLPGNSGLGAGHGGVHPNEKWEPSSSVPPEVLNELTKQIGICDDQAARQLWGECRSKYPDCTPVEVCHFIQEKARLMKGGNVRNPVGFLLRAVPICFESEAYRQYRKELARQSAQNEIEEGRKTE